MRDVAYIALGSNLGDRKAHLAFALKRLAGMSDSRVLAFSEVEETEPVSADPQPQECYLNQIVALETTLSPHDLLAELQKIELGAGRIREKRWGPRTLDLDIVLFEKQTVHTPTLTVPHPELGRRDFWQRELDQVRIR
jgi:2-amino-4-hydroxy-6-hydroxymethyldihydropteridine diphosphokinase